MSFKSWQSYWDFSRKVIYKNRYLFDEETEYFINEVIRTSENRLINIEPGEIYYRAQIGSKLKIIETEHTVIWEQTIAFPLSRMKPLEHEALEGRVNPKGIPFLYMAEKPKTAMSECRPWKETEISLAKFKTLRSLKIIDCSLNHASNPFFFNGKECYEPSEEEREKAVWSHIDKAFSEPVTRNENTATYIPTQILAEAFKSVGYDGVMYKSMLGSGNNIVLFNSGDADPIECNLFKASHISISYEELPKMYSETKE